MTLEERVAALEAEVAQLSSRLEACSCEENKTTLEWTGEVIEYCSDCSPPPTDTDTLAALTAASTVADLKPILDATLGVAADARRRFEYIFSAGMALKLGNMDDRRTALNALEQTIRDHHAILVNTPASELTDRLLTLTNELHADHTVECETLMQSDDDGGGHPGSQDPAAPPA